MGELYPLEMRLRVKLLASLPERARLPVLRDSGGAKELTLAALEREGAEARELDRDLMETAARSPSTAYLNDGELGGAHGKPGDG